VIDLMAHRTLCLGAGQSLSRGELSPRRRRQRFSIKPAALDFRCCSKKFAASLGSDNVKNDIIANELMLG
jgi:hypothetical protein